jgi:hypothetical protein
MASAFDGDSQLALLLGGKAGLRDRLNPTVGIDVPLESLHVAVIEVQIRIAFDFFHFDTPSLLLIKMVPR